MTKKTTNKIQVQVVAGAPQFDVSDFPKDVERSNGNGAVYFRQNTILGLTEGEVNHVKAARPDMVKYLVISEVKKPTEAQLKSRIAAKAKAEEKVEADEKAKKEAEEQARKKEGAENQSSDPTPTPTPAPAPTQPERNTKGNNAKNKKR